MKSHNGRHTKDILHYRGPHDIVSAARQGPCACVGQADGLISIHRHEARQKHFPLIADDCPVVVFLSEPNIGADGHLRRHGPGYSLHGRGDGSA